MPRFHVRETFVINDKATFVLSGSVLEGEVLAGMSVSLPFNSKIQMTAPIARVELVPRPDGNIVCLCIDCHHPNEATLWIALSAKNKIIDIIESTESRI